jgi:5-formyltetrahydrofolate cyclo-ligase
MLAPIDKPTQRRQWLADRRAIAPADWQRWSGQICHNLRQLPIYQQAKTILAYSSYRQEPDLSGLFDDRGKVWGLPRCVDRDLVWHRFDSRVDTLQPGAFGILEPESDWPQLRAAEVDLILVPAVGCDRRGYRLGYGGGFYDRLLADPDWAAIPTIGITFSPMLVEILLVDPWDCPLTIVCTELPGDWPIVDHQFDRHPAP